jgi:hypothetical protein
MWAVYLFLYFLLTIVVTLGLGLAVRLRPSVPLRRALVLVLLSGAVALCAVVVQRAFDKPLLWVVVAILVLLVVFGGPVALRDSSRRRQR